ncbi:hypothetical protein A2456_02245 [Candidatus Nomurabacteria bacterium RIFOXYC2_FULL_36_19]|uniref:Uncharacterized protein n=1 Tax=Candidatus Nomurabacteria bacterium RIFOXYC2_FULL_36_19 TaxID=1801806 RepID=A0A1F6YWR2_9BACT|nr:MAG: hypothetical protein A2456_02245 [Candidatus Nomurabacteria bacterium RIFOXYC2_FULL_36_19]OGJ13625.1 MAG: hypothetical protein A2554_03770 [Candidatus Nomurabacteria bacterium RIFOXYD2_FULL_35_12]
MKKLPLTIIPIITSAIVALAFIFFVPKDGDLISKSGDFTLGYIIGYSFGITLLVDLIRLIIRVVKRNKLRNNK